MNEVHSLPSRSSQSGAMVKSRDFSVSLVQIPGLSLAICVTLDKSLGLNFVT